MNDVLNWLKDNYQLLISGLLVVFSIIQLFIKRKPQTIDDFISCVSDASNQVATWCKSVEIPGHGELKNAEVHSKAIKFVRFKLHRELSPTEIDYINKTIEGQINDVLDAPTREEKGEL